MLSRLEYVLCTMFGVPSRIRRRQKKSLTLVFQTVNEASEIVNVLSMIPSFYHYKLLHCAGSLVHFWNGSLENEEKEIPGSQWTDELGGESTFNSVNSWICTLLILDSGEHLSAWLLPVCKFQYRNVMLLKEGLTRFSSLIPDEVWDSIWAFSA